MNNYTETPGWRATRKRWYQSQKGAKRVFELQGWPLNTLPSGQQVYARPKPWLVRVGSNISVETIEWYTDGVVQFLHAAIADLQNYAIPYGRDRPLICVPFVGAGFGGAADRVGALIHSLFDAVERILAATHCDVAFVTLDGAHYAAAQAVRQKRQCFSRLEDRLFQRARKLADLAASGHLAVFIGAGVSRSCGLPDWTELLEKLATAAGLSDEERVWLSHMSLLDRARILEKRLGGGTNLQTAVAELINTDFLAMGHALLASLPVRQYITTNYDLHTERGLAFCGRAFRVIPYAKPSSSLTSCFVLKLHGCVRHPEDIVLTRDDYLRYGERRAALAGVVSTALITQHLLFVGFSLSDENFHNINSVVRKLSPTDHRGNATALQLDTNPLIMELNDNIEIVSMTSPGSNPAGPQLGAAARQLEIVLDMIACYTVSPIQHLLNKAFDPLLSDDERLLRTAMHQLNNTIPPRLIGTPFVDRLQKLFVEFGAGSHSSYNSISDEWD